MPGPTLEQLERQVWPAPEYHSSLVVNCHRLRKKPVADLEPSELRRLIGQQIGLPHLIPRTLEILEREPLIDAEYFPGDLLASVIECADWLRSQPELVRRVVAVSRRAVTCLDATEELRERLERFVTTQTASI
jgi:hypothetical protein